MIQYLLNDGHFIVHGGAQEFLAVDPRMIERRLDGNGGKRKRAVG
jgi:hypothetical protein